MNSPRSGRIWVDRQLELRAVRELGFADAGLLCRIWMDMAWRARRIHVAGAELRLKPGQALISASEYARESGACRAWIREALARLSDGKDGRAKWIRVESTPAGAVVTCLVRPSGEVPEADQDQAPEAPQEPSEAAEEPPAGGPSGGGGGGSSATRGVVAAVPGGWHQRYQGGGSSGATTVNTPAGGTPAGSTPAGPKSCSTGGGSYPDQPRARDNVVAAPPCRVLELHPVTAATCRAAGVPPGEALELVARGHDEARVLGRALQLAAKLRTGFRPRSAIAWLRDKVSRGPGSIEIHETAKRMLGRCGTLPLGWLPAQAPAEAASVGDVLRRAAAGRA